MSTSSPKVEPIALYKRREGVYEFVREGVICKATWERASWDGRLRVEAEGCVWVVPELALSTVTTASLNTTTLVHVAISSSHKDLRILVGQDRYSLGKKDLGMGIFDGDGELLASTTPSWKDSEAAAGLLFTVWPHKLPGGPRGTLLLSFTLFGHGLLREVPR